MNWQEAVEWGRSVTALLAGAGGGAAVAVAVFKAFGQGWLDEKFKQRLEVLKHEQVKSDAAAGSVGV